jgi:hypothetical protein
LESEVAAVVVCHLFDHLQTRLGCEGDRSHVHRQYETQLTPFLSISMQNIDVVMVVAAVV